MNLSKRLALSGKSRSSKVNGKRAFLVDTLALLVRSLEAQGVPSKQAEAITSAITEVLNDSLENVSESFVSKAEMQKIEMLQDSNLSKFKPSQKLSVQLINSASSLHQQFKPLKPPRRIPQRSERTFEAPGIVDDFYLKILDWSSANVLAVALDNSVCLWDAFTGSVTELVTRLRTLEGFHHTRVGSLAWNSHILTTGVMDEHIFNNDVQIRSYVVATYKGHTQEVCGLKWSGSGQRLASGGKDSLMHLWDRSSSTQWLHRLMGHTSAVKALVWCPFQSNLLASGGRQI
ncbi:hypothetical protein Bca52824_031761 [Brassica carinata]|uniref:Uncharacterized protein n=1 Tax=Brassica carinata TaxID=52824 RepID=A0A8X7SAN0_BRACI|nr:hypothetical protein Bca52824_031761 [Brassica carinata]